jgi:quaternary ammonium compound-resistance protein SugE
LFDLNWIYLIVGGLLEPLWIISLEKSKGFKRIGWGIAAAVLIVASPYFLSLAMKEIPMGTAYSIWTGLGAVFTLIAGRMVYGERIKAARMLFVAMIVSGVVGLELLGVY